MTNYQEFWNYYLSVHQSVWTQRIHVLGTLVGLLVFFYGALTLSPLWIGLSFAIGYGFAWPSHFFIEKNRPATFQYPWWSFLSDFRLLYFFVRGGGKKLHLDTK